MKLTFAAALLGFLSVALGAFGAHGLKSKLTPETLAWWETATLYGLVHASAALSVGFAGKGGGFSIGGWAFVIGALIFSGTLYAMALGAPRVLGAITPIGGTALLIGWGAIAFAAITFSGKS